MQIRWSGLGIVDGRGAIGGSQVSQNKSGAIASVRQRPNNPRTSAQFTARNNYFKTLQAWRGLAGGQRILWDEAAALPANARTNSVGEEYQPTGQSLFIECNLNVIGIASQISEPEPNPVFSSVEFLSITPVDPSPFEISFGTGPQATTEVIRIFATQTISKGNVSTKQPNYRFIQNIAYADYATTIDITDRYVEVWGAPKFGGKIFAQCFLIDTVGGYRKSLGTQYEEVTQVV